jgi:hypothetical protein
MITRHALRSDVMKLLQQLLFLDGCLQMQVDRG